MVSSSITLEYEGCRVSLETPLLGADRISASGACDEVQAKEHVTAACGLRLSAAATSS